MAGVLLQSVILHRVIEDGDQLVVYRLEIGLRLNSQTQKNSTLDFVCLIQAEIVRIMDGLFVNEQQGKEAAAKVIFAAPFMAAGRGQIASTRRMHEYYS